MKKITFLTALTALILSSTSVSSQTYIEGTPTGPYGALVGKGTAVGMLNPSDFTPPFDESCSDIGLRSYSVTFPVAQVTGIMHYIKITKIVKGASTIAPSVRYTNEFTGVITVNLNVGDTFRINLNPTLGFYIDYDGSSDSVYFDLIGIGTPGPGTETDPYSCNPTSLNNGPAMGFNCNAQYSVTLAGASSCAVSAPNSVTELGSSSSAAIFANPFDGKLNKILLKQQINEVRVFDCLGKEVAVQTGIKHNAVQLEVNNKGVYFVKALGLNGRIYTQKLIFN